MHTCRLFCVSDPPGNLSARTLLRPVLAMGERGWFRRTMAPSIRRPSSDANSGLESPALASYTTHSRLVNNPGSSVQPDTVDSGAEPINLYRLGMLFVVKCRYWSCRAGNDPDELDLTPDRIDARASR